MTTYFHTLNEEKLPLFFTAFEIAPGGNQKPGFHPGVLIIRKGIAKGHFAVREGNRVVNFDPWNEEHKNKEKFQIVIGDATLDDVVKCASGDTVKCKLDHGGTVKDIVGGYSNFRRETDEVRADFELMESTQHRAFVEELFSKMSKKVGNSIAFDFAYEINNGVAIARVVKLNSVDIVDTPAATNSLFNENPDNQPTRMALTKEEIDQLGTMLDGKLAVIKSEFSTAIAALDGKVTKLETKPAPATPPAPAEGANQFSADQLKTAVLAGVREIFPKTTIENLNSLAANPPGAPKDEWAEKVALCEAAGVKDPALQVRHIAKTWPAVYTTKFGNGGGQKGSATLAAK